MGSPFDSGKTLVFKSKSAASKHYLNSYPAHGSVFMGYSIDFSRHPGCYWESNKQADGSYRLKTVSASADRRYLDSNAAKGYAYLNDASAGKGSYWTPTQLPDGSYSLHSQSPSGSKCFLNCKAGDHVNLVESSDSTGTHWMVGVDYYTGAEVESIIHDVYPGTEIKFYPADPKFGSLDYDLLYGIWKDSRLGDYQWTEHKFDCDDFAVCLKGEASKYSYNQKLPVDKGSLCGIMWGSNATIAHAFNFTIDPFGKLILFEPQNGKEIPYNEYTPYFCMV